MKTETKREAEARQLARLEKEKQRPALAMGLLVTMILITIIYVVDEITSNINSAMQPYILFDLFKIASRDVNSPEYAGAINTVAPISLASNLLLIVTPFYKALSDRFGRKVFLMINTAGMGLGMLVVMTSSTVYQYILGMLLMMFFTPNDMQVLYIMETAPKERRATYCFVSKAIALVSVSLIGLASHQFLREDVPSSWKMVYAIPVITALAVGIGSYFVIRETPVFVDQRLKYLKMTPEERKAKEEKDKADKVAETGGVFKAIRFIFTNPQLRWIMIAGFLFYATTVYTSYYATVLEGAMSTAQVSIALMIYPFFNGISTFLSGLLSDRLGRKKVCLVLGGTALVALVVFVLACRLGWGPIVAGAAYGISIGGLWSMCDTLVLTMPAESTPSGMRSSVMGTISVLIGAGMFVGNIIFIIGQNFQPMDNLFLAIVVPFMAISLLILMTKVKETKDVDLEQVTADTFRG